VLDTHAAEAVEQWLVAHPEVHTICRDRNGRYAKAARTGAPTAMQVADRFHLVQNLRETIERELCLHRAHLRVRLRGPGGPPSPHPGPAHDVESLPVCVPGVARERRLLPARRLAVETEIKRQRRQLAQDLFDRFKALHATGLPIARIAHQLGRHRRRFDRWAKLSALPVRSRIPPRPGSAESFREYLHQRWQAGYRNGRMLFDEIRAAGYRGTYKSLQKLVSPWRVGNATLERDTSVPTRSPVAAGAPAVDTISTPPPCGTDPTARQISPQIAVALLAKPRPELTARQGAIVDALKAECPGYAVMRPLMLGFRSLLRQPTTPTQKARPTAALHQWLDRAHATGIPLIQNFVCLLRRDILAVEAAVTTRWSNGPVEGQVNRLKMLKRQMYGRAGVELLRARLLPLPADLPTVQRM
jgi:hypothetical protein